MRWGGALKLDLRPSTETDTFEFHWIDLTESKEKRAGTVKGGAAREFHAPENYPAQPQPKDWILHIRRRAS